MRLSLFRQPMGYFNDGAIWQQNKKDDYLWAIRKIATQCNSESNLGHGITLCDGVGRTGPARGKGLSAPQFRESSFTMSVNNANGLARSLGSGPTDATATALAAMRPPYERGRE